MAWWSRFARPGAPPSRRSTSAFDPDAIPMPGWALVGEEPAAAFWRDAAGDVVGLHRVSRRLSHPPLADETDVQRYCRRVAQAQNAGLIEVATADAAEGPCVTYVYKAPYGAGFKFYGAIEVPVTGAIWTWMVVAVEGAPRASERRSLPRDCSTPAS